MKSGPTDNTAIACSVAGEESIGVSGEISYASGDPVDIYVQGTVPVYANGAISAGAKIMTAANGKAATHSGDNVVAGIAVTSGVADDLIQVQLS